MAGSSERQLAASAHGAWTKRTAPGMMLHFPQLLQYTHHAVLGFSCGPQRYCVPMASVTSQGLGIRGFCLLIGVAWCLPHTHVQPGSWCSALMRFTGCPWMQALCSIAPETSSPSSLI